MALPFDDSSRRTNNTFSVATFISNPELAFEDNVHEAEYSATASWQELLPEACEKVVMEAMAAKAPTLPLLGGLRKRTRSGVDYNDMDVSLENSSDETDALRKMRKGTRARVGRGVPATDEEPHRLDSDTQQWSDRELKRLEDQLFALGRGRTGKDFLFLCLTSPSFTGRIVLGLTICSFIFKSTMFVLCCLKFKDNITPQTDSLLQCFRLFHLYAYVKLTAS